MPLIFCVLLAGSSWGREKSLDLKSVVAYGYVVLDDVDMVHFEHYYPDEKGESFYAAVVTKLTQNGRKEIRLRPVTAQKIAREAEPYFALYLQNKTFGEQIEINENISVELKSDGKFHLTIIDRHNGTEVAFLTDTSKKFIDNMLNAEEASKLWVTNIYSRLLPASAATVASDNSLQSPNTEERRKTAEKSEQTVTETPKEQTNGKNPAALKSSLLMHVRKKTAVPWNDGEWLGTMYNVKYDPDSRDSKKDFNFVVSFNVEPRSWDDVEGTYEAIILITKEYLEEAGVDTSTGDFIVRVRLFIPGKALADTPEMKDKIYPLGKGHWRPGQYESKFNRYWWDWTDGE